jgi:hypothetical protein
MQNFEVENNLEENVEDVIYYFIEKNLLSEYLINKEKVSFILPKEFSFLSELEKFNFKFEIPKI